MKRLIIIFTLLLALCSRPEASGAVEITSANFPDSEFCEFVKQYDIGEKYDHQSGIRIGKNDGVLSSIELSWVTGMNAPGRNLKGLEHFFNLDTFGCRYNGLDTLDVSSLPKLKYFRRCDNGNRQ